MVTTLNACAQLPGRRFYRYYLEDLNRRFNDFGETTEAKIGERNIRFACPNLLTRWRVETLRSKEPATLDWIDGFSPGDTLWDVGNNIGIYSIYAAVARACRVVAFEPSPVNFALLERNIVLNGLSEKIVAFPVALCESQRIDLLNMANMDAGVPLQASAEGPRKPLCGSRASAIPWTISSTNSHRPFRSILRLTSMATRRRSCTARWTDACRSSRALSLDRNR